MAEHISATEARQRFGAIMQQVCDSGEPVVVDKGGQPKVVIAPATEAAKAPQVRGAEAPQSLRKRRERSRAALAGQETAALPKGAEQPPHPDELIEQMRQHRRHIGARLERLGITLPPAWQTINEIRDERSDHHDRLFLGSATAGAPSLEQQG